MADNAFIGQQGLARHTKEWYVGVNGIARRVASAYVGVNGVARKIFPTILTGTLEDGGLYTEDALLMAPCSGEYTFYFRARKSFKGEDCDAKAAGLSCHAAGGAAGIDRVYKFSINLAKNDILEFKTGVNINRVGDIGFIYNNNTYWLRSATNGTDAHCQSCGDCSCSEAVTPGNNGAPATIFVPSGVTVSVVTNERPDVINTSMGVNIDCVDYPVILNIDPFSKDETNVNMYIKDFNII